MAVASLDPVPLERLAEHLRDGAWLDMRVVERGLLKRVRLFEIIVRRDEEDIGAEQEYLAEAADDNDQTEVGRTTYHFPQDMVRWARPTSFTIEDIARPLSPEEEIRMERAREWAEQKAEEDHKFRVFDADPFNEYPPFQDEHSIKVCEKVKRDSPNDWLLRNRILEAVEQQFGTSPALTIRGSHNRYSWSRKWCIRMMWELTDIAQTKIPELFGYSSGGMSYDALYRTQDQPEVAKEILAKIKLRWTTRRGELPTKSSQVRLLS